MEGAEVAFPGVRDRKVAVPRAGFLVAAATKVARAARGAVVLAEACLPAPRHPLCPRASTGLPVKGDVLPSLHHNTTARPGTRCSHLATERP